jgi:hypothetical protein
LVHLLLQHRDHAVLFLHRHKYMGCEILQSVSCFLICILRPSCPCCLTCASCHRMLEFTLMLHHI